MKQTKKIYASVILVLTLVLMMLTAGCSRDDATADMQDYSAFDDANSNGLWAQSFESEWRIDGRGTGVTCQQRLADGRINFTQLPLAALVDTINLVLGEQGKVADYRPVSAPPFNRTLTPLGAYFSNGVVGSPSDSYYYFIERLDYAFGVESASHPEKGVKQAVFCMAEPSNSNLLSVISNAMLVVADISVSEIRFEGETMRRYPTPLRMTCISSDILSSTRK